MLSRRRQPLISKDQDTERERGRERDGKVTIHRIFDMNTSANNAAKTFEANTGHSTATEKDAFKKWRWSSVPALTYNPTASRYTHAPPCCSRAKENQRQRL